ncbi:hypothetical protein BV25DRAFT_1775210, partial [Artomyces pyxidatus]
SADTVYIPGPSIIERAPKLRGPQGPCAILGPFRMVNHDCDPNAQIYAIPRSCACVVISIREIDAGEEITVKYNATGYYAQRCGCKTCTGKDP